MCVNANRTQFTHKCILNKLIKNHRYRPVSKQIHNGVNNERVCVYDKNKLHLYDERALIFLFLFFAS